MKINYGVVVAAGKAETVVVPEAGVVVSVVAGVVSVAAGAIAEVVVDVVV